MESSRSVAPFKLHDAGQWKAAQNSARPVLVHLNGDTTWLLQLPYPPDSSSSNGRSHFNILIDPWLQGSQSDVASWFSTQWHVVDPGVKTIAELDTCLAQLETTGGTAGSDRDSAASHIDLVVISHEFTDHCHEATLRELPPSVPVFATEKAAALIRSWKHFDTVAAPPGFPSSNEHRSWEITLADKTGTLPPWIGVGRVVTEGNALYYHSAVLIAFNLKHQSNGKSGNEEAEALVYSPHGIKGSDLECLGRSGIRTLALLHGLHDVQIWMTAQLNLGALNGIQAARACGAKYWVATHDEVKKGGGFISWLLRRTVYSLRDAVEAEVSREGQVGPRAGTDDFCFLELGSGHVLVLE